MIAVRGTVATGFRAPALQQQYFTATSTNFLSVNGVSTPVEVGTFPATSAVAQSLGGKALEPEDSVNYSLGLVFRTGGFEATVDAYRIDINNRIVLSENIQCNPSGTPTAQAICRLINPPGTNAQLGAARFFINGVDTETSGIDIVARYRWDLDNLGQLDLTGAANYNDTSVTGVPQTSVLDNLPVPPSLFDRANRLTFEEGTPASKYVLNADWTQGAFGVSGKLTRYGDVLSPSNNPALDYQVGEHVLLDVEGRWNSEGGLGLALGVTNALDEYPNRTPVTVNTNGPIGFPGFSPLGFNGRYVYARLSYNW
jgi:iron complex outermembrane receptor protein